MRQTARRALLAIVSMIAVVTVGLVSVFTAAFALGATALIVPGTGTPQPNSYPEYIQDARNYYLRDTACGAPDTCVDLGQNLVGIDYPASFWPLAIIPGWCEANCQKWDVSVADGVDNLETAIVAALADPEQRVVVYGHSQGAAVVSNTLRRLNTSLTDEEKARVQVVVTGNVDNPAGGMWSRIGFLGRIPILDLTTGLPTLTDTGITFTSIAMQYDGASNAPKYWGNLLSLANAVAGFAYLHGTTLIPDERTPVGVPDYYPTVDEYLAAVYDPANAKHDGYGNTYIVVPSPILPIALPFLDLAARTGTTPLVKPVVDLVSPVLRVLLDLGYDPDEQPGVYSNLSILPFSPRTNPVKVAADLLQAVGQGIRDATHGGAALPSPPAVALSAAPPRTSRVTTADDLDAQPSPTPPPLSRVGTTSTKPDTGKEQVPVQRRSADEELKREPKSSSPGQGASAGGDQVLTGVTALRENVAEPTNGELEPATLKLTRTVDDGHTNDAGAPQSETANPAA